MLILIFSLFLFDLARVITGYVRDDCVCGLVSSDNRRIVNGVEAKPLKYQWMVALFNAHDKPHCGGALISDMHVLTAGHCISFDKNHPNYWKLLNGKIRAHDIINKGESMNFDHVYMHPLYAIKEQYDDFDIAILKYRETIKLFWHLRTLCIPHERKYYGGKNGVITGWGTVNEEVQRMEQFLREGKIKILHTSQCPAATNLQYLFNSQSMMCGFAKAGIDTCQGDSGGPLITERRNKVYEVIGVASFGSACGGQYAGVYADITQALPWIWGIINTTGICPPPHK